MQVYAQPIWSAVLLSPAIAAVLTVPYWVMRESNLSDVRLLGIACMIALGALFAYTLIDIIRAVLSGGPRRLWYERISHTAYESTLRSDSRADPPAERKQI